MFEKEIPKSELEMYRITPAPPKWELHEYIKAYKGKKNDNYLNWFLHYYEHTLNRNVLDYMRRLFMPEHFADLKQAYVMGLLKALERYDISQGVLFTVFKEHYGEKEIFDYVRSMRTGYTVQSLAEYRRLRKAMAIWERFDRVYDDDALRIVALELDENVKNTKEILLGGILNENQAEFYKKYADEDSESTSEEVAVDNSSEPYHLYTKWTLYDRLWKAFDRLEYEGQAMLSQRYGFCLSCHSVFYMDADDLDEYGEPKKKPIEKMLYTDIATDHEYSSANTAKAKCNKALAKLREAIQDFI